MSSIRIDTREEYDYLVGRGYEPLVDEWFEIDHNLRVELQREKFGKNDAEGNQKFYKFCLHHYAHYCRECGRPINNPSAYNVSHIISRAADARMSHDPRNVYILCPECHNRYEHITTRRDMRIFDRAEERKEKLKHEYNGEIKS